MIADNLRIIKCEIQKNIVLVAVSKTKPIENILEAYSMGQRIFGENKAQEMLTKSAVLPADIQWHMIGHLQSNKVKYIAPFVSLIHSVDSLSLLQIINKEAKKNNRVIECLFEVGIAIEETKYGLDKKELEEICESLAKANLVNIKIRGLMGMASFTNDEAIIHNEFSSLKRIFDKLKTKYFTDAPDFNILSMGMSGDYKIAIEEGSTMVRIGSSIFGERNYTQP